MSSNYFHSYANYTDTYNTIGANPTYWWENAEKPCPEQNRLKLIEQQLKQMKKTIGEIKIENENLQKRITELEFKPNEVINCPSCNIDIEIDKGGGIFNEAKDDFNNMKEKS